MTKTNCQLAVILFIVFSSQVSSAQAGPPAPPPPAPPPAPAPPPPQGKVKEFFYGFMNRLDDAREARCKTAICWGQGNKYAIEPLAELPIGKAFASEGSGLGQYVNNHDVSIQLTAGLRFWFLKDYASISIYLAKPLVSGDAAIRVAGSSVEHSSSEIRNPYPGVALGLLADAIWLGMDYYELRNGDTDMNRDPAFPRNAVISRQLVFTLAFQPFTIMRNGIGIVAGATSKSATK